MQYRCLCKDFTDVTTSLSHSWEAFIPPHVGVTLGRILHYLVAIASSVPNFNPRN